MGYNRGFYGLKGIANLIFFERLGGIIICVAFFSKFCQISTISLTIFYSYLTFVDVSRKDVAQNYSLVPKYALLFPVNNLIPYKMKYCNTIFENEWNNILKTDLNNLVFETISTLKISNFSLNARIDF